MTERTTKNLDKFFNLARANLSAYQARHAAAEDIKSLTEEEKDQLAEMVLNNLLTAPTTSTDAIKHGQTSADTSNTPSMAATMKALGRLLGGIASYAKYQLRTVAGDFQAGIGGRVAFGASEASKTSSADVAVFDNGMKLQKIYAEPRQENDKPLFWLVSCPPNLLIEGEDGKKLDARSLKWALVWVRDGKSFTVTGADEIVFDAAGECEIPFLDGSSFDLELAPDYIGPKDIGAHVAQ